MQLGRYEIRPTKIFKQMNHDMNHFAHWIERHIPAAITFGIYPDPDPWYTLHRNSYPEGSYELIRRVPYFDKIPKPNVI